MYSIKIDRDELHSKIGGGFPEGSLVLIEGEYGSGKSALTQRFAYGFLLNGYSVTIISTELTVRDFIKQMYSLNYPIAGFLLRNRLLFIPVYPIMGKIRNRQDFLGRLMASPQLFKTDIIIIDTLSALVKASLNAETRAIQLLSFFKKITAMDRTIILTVESGVIDDKIMAPFRATADVYMETKINKIGNIVNRLAFVRRYSNAPSRVDNTIAFRVESGTGIILEIMAVS